MVKNWLLAHGGMPQGSWFGPLVFILFINDLLPSCLSYKYIDDLTLSEFLHEDVESKMSVLFNNVIRWSDCNNMNINIGKTKEMLIGSCKRVPDLLCLNRADCIERVRVFKLHGVLINSGLNWNDPVNFICSNSNSRLFS